MKLILIRSPQLFFYKMKSKREDKNMTTDTIKIVYNYNVKWKKSCRKVNILLKHICMKTVNRYYRN